MAVTFHNADVKFTLKNTKELKDFIHQHINTFAPQHIRLSFVFCSDEYLLNINRQFLNHDYYTDIITFPLNETEETLEGEIYISIDRVKENAEKYGREKSGIGHRTSDKKDVYLPELQRVIFHGVLHLLGYKDKTKLQKEQMRKMEDLWLRRFKKFQAEQ